MGSLPFFRCVCVHSFLVRLACVRAAWHVSHVAWCWVAFSRAFALALNLFLCPRHPWAGRAGRAADRVAVLPSICVSGHVCRSLSARACRSLRGVVNFARLALSRVFTHAFILLGLWPPSLLRQIVSLVSRACSFLWFLGPSVVVGLRVLQTSFVVLSHFISAAFPFRGRAAFL